MAPKQLIGPESPKIQSKQPFADLRLHMHSVMPCVPGKTTSRLARACSCFHCWDQQQMESPISPPGPGQWIVVCGQLDKSMNQDWVPSCKLIALICIEDPSGNLGVSCWRQPLSPWRTHCTSGSYWKLPLPSLQTVFRNTACLSSSFFPSGFLLTFLMLEWTVQK